MIMSILLLLRSQVHVDERDSYWETTCWGCKLQLTLPQFAPIFKCGYCGAVTVHKTGSNKSPSRWTRRCGSLLDYCLVTLAFLLVVFIVCKFFRFPLSFTLNLSVDNVQKFCHIHTITVLSRMFFSGNSGLGSHGSNGFSADVVQMEVFGRYFQFCFLVLLSACTFILSSPPSLHSTRCSTSCWPPSFHQDLRLQSNGASLK